MEFLGVFRRIVRDLGQSLDVAGTLTVRGAKILLDLNFPAFQDDLLGLDANELRPVLKTLRKLKTLDWETVYRDPGLKWEQVKEAPGKFTIRIARRSRAVVRREGDYMRFVAIHTEHDAAYGKK